MIRDAARSTQYLTVAFAALFVLVIGIAVLVRADVIASGEPNLIATALTIDITVFLPLMYYVLLVRGLGWPKTSVIPVFILTVIVAGFVIPSDRQHALDLIHVLMIPFEFFVLAFVAWKARSGYVRLKQIRADGQTDAYAAIRESVENMVPNSVVRELLTFELCVLYFGVCGWFIRRESVAVDSSPDPSTSFTMHRKSGYLGLLIALQMAMAMELFGIHLLVHLYWSPTIAWILSALSLYGIIWLWADWHALRLRSTTIDETELWLRVGFRWQAKIERSAVIEAFAIRGGGLGKPDKSTLDASLLSNANIELKLAAPQKVQGVYGLQRTVESIRLTVDDPSQFLAMFSAPLNPGSHTEEA